MSSASNALQKLRSASESLSIDKIAEVDDAVQALAQSIDTITSTYIGGQSKHHEAMDLLLDLKSKICRLRNAWPIK